MLKVIILSCYSVGQKNAYMSNYLRLLPWIYNISSDTSRMNMTKELESHHIIIICITRKMLYLKLSVALCFGLFGGWEIKFSLREEAGQAWIWSGTRWCQSLADGQCSARMLTLQKLLLLEETRGDLLWMIYRWTMQVIIGNVIRTIVS
jgi:hypothetical protein